MTGRIFITGDKHGTFGPFFGLAERNQLQEEDILLITGDAGYVWDQNYPTQIQTLEQLFPGAVAFVDGNHENHALLNALPEEMWNGGRVHRVGERVYHLMRGELYDLYGSRVFTFGGARSVDVDRREDGFSWWKERGESWWPEEEPSAEEIAYGQRQLTEHLDEIDYVITHETPLLARGAIARSKTIDPDYQLPALFDTWYALLEGAPRFRQWYFGHMHVDQVITPKLRGLHNQILPLGGEERVRWA